MDKGRDAPLELHQASTKENISILIKNIILTSKLPFEGINKHLINTGCIINHGAEEDTVPADIECPKPISDLIRMCLFRNPDHRPTIKEVISLLNPEINVANNNNIIDRSTDEHSSVLGNLYSVTNKLRK